MADTLLLETGGADELLLETGGADAVLLESAVPAADTIGPQFGHRLDVFLRGYRRHRSVRKKRKGLVLWFGNIQHPPPVGLLPSVRKRFDCIARSRSRHRGRERRRDF